MNSKPFQPQSWKELFASCCKAQDLLLKTVLNLKYEMERNTGHTIIRSISSRLKNYESIQEKLIRLNLEPTLENAASQLHDVAGVRIICSYLCDLQAVVQALEDCPDLAVVEIKDYVQDPKPSGYRSIHVIVEVPVLQERIPCEIQLRTTSMDAWAALEHQMRYKNDGEFSARINNELADCAKLLYETDCRMQKINQLILQEQDPH